VRKCADCHEIVPESEAQILIVDGLPMWEHRRCMPKRADVRMTAARYERVRR